MKHERHSRDFWLNIKKQYDDNFFKDLNANVDKSLEMFNSNANKDYRKNSQASEIYKSIVDTFCSNVFRTLPEPVVSFRQKSTSKDQSIVAHDAKLINAIKSIVKYTINNSANNYVSDDLGAIMPSLINEAYLTGRSWVRLSTAKTNSKLSPDIITLTHIPVNTILWDCCRQYPKDWQWLIQVHHFSDEQFFDLFGEQKTDEIDKQLTVSNTGDNIHAVSTPDGQKFLKPDWEVWEVWDKVTKKVLFILANNAHAIHCDHIGDHGVLSIEDPDVDIGDAFFPYFMLTSKKLIQSGIPYVPICDYYNSLVELDILQITINDIRDTSNFAGLISKDLASKVGPMLMNTIPGYQVVDASTLADNNMATSIYQFDKSSHTNMIQYYEISKQQIIDRIYKISGINDLLQGYQAPNETATATMLKDRYGQSRLVSSQQIIDNFIANIFASIVQCIPALGKKSIMVMANLDLDLGKDLEINDIENTDKMYPTDAIIDASIYNILKNNIHDLDLVIQTSASTASAEEIDKNKQIQSKQMFLQMVYGMISNLQDPRLLNFNKIFAMAAAKDLGLDETIIEEIGNITAELQETNNKPQDVMEMPQDVTQDLAQLPLPVNNDEQII